MTSTVDIYVHIIQIYLGLSSLYTYIIIMKNVFEYLDYRSYLSDYYTFRKSERETFSLRFLGSKIGIDASYLSKVFKGDRHIAEKSLDKLCSYINFSVDEVRYFKILFLFNKSKKEEQKGIYFEKLLALRPRRQTNIEQSQYRYFSEWYHSALRLVLEYYPFHIDDSYQALGEQLSPSITASQAKESISLLLKLELIRSSSAGRLLLSDTAISTGESWHSLAITNYQKKVIELSSESIARHPQDERDISTVTMNITQKEFKMVQRMIKEFRSSVIDYVNQAEEPDQTFQLNVQMIPISKPLQGK